MNYGENDDRRGDDSASDQHNSYACDRCGSAGWVRASRYSNGARSADLYVRLMRFDPEHQTA